MWYMLKPDMIPSRARNGGKMTFVNGEQLHTRNEAGVHSIINAIKVKVRV